MYAAYDPELDRKIALKILHPGADAGGRARERLLREAQALARLSHPNVVAVHDVGTHEGQVFVAMEFIAGATLSATIAKQRPSSAEILRLYRAAGEGLAAAHRAGLVHRDFKPDNVMVGSDGRVRVVDFGLAHAAVEANPDGAQDLAAAPSGLTATGALMGTPAYMAPEQYLGRPTDARTDVFAYCVALYEHLHGRRPFAGETLVELAQAVTSGKLPEVTAGGTRVPSAVRRILLRGLARDPADRYPSMEALLADLDRALARPRRRVVWIAGGVLGLVAAGAAAFALGRPDRAEAGCRRIADEFAGVWSPEAREAGARAFSATGLAYAADAWTRTSARIDDWVARWAEARRDACLEAAGAAVSPALSDRRAGCFDRQRARLAALLEVFAGADAEVVERGGESVAALPDPRECSTAALSGEGPPPPSPENAAKVEALGRRLATHETRFRATYAEAELAAIEALLAEARALEEGPVIAEVAAVSAEAHAILVRADAAEERYLEALTVAEAVGDTRRVAAVLPRWILFLTRIRSAYTEARHLERRVEALLQRVGGDEAILFSVLEARAVLAHHLGERERARAEYEAAIELGARLYGVDSLRLADLHNNFGGMLVALDEAEARAQIRRAFEIWERALGPDHPKLAYATMNLARTAGQRGEIHEAERLYRDALDRLTRVDPDHPHIGPMLSNLASSVEYTEGPERARELRLEALARLRRKFGDEHNFIVQAAAILGTTEQAAGRFDEARAHIEEALAVSRKLFGEAARETRMIEARLLDVAIGRGDAAEAGALADTLFAWHEGQVRESGGEDDTLVLGLVAEARLLQGRRDEARALAERVLRIDPQGSRTAFVLARLARERGDIARARELARVSLEDFEKWPRQAPLQLQALREFLAQLERDERAARKRAVP